MFTESYRESLGIESGQNRDKIENPNLIFDISKLKIG